jgi:hypothetical protein
MNRKLVGNKATALERKLRGFVTAETACDYYEYARQLAELYALYSDILEEYGISYKQMKYWLVNAALIYGYSLEYKMATSNDNFLKRKLADLCIDFPEIQEFLGISNAKIHRIKCGVMT